MNVYVWKIPEVGVLTFVVLPSETEEFFHVCLRKCSNGLPSSEAYKDSYLNSSLSFLLTPSEIEFSETSSPTTRPGWSHRKLQLGEWRIFLCCVSLPDPTPPIVLSLAATQQTDPIFQKPEMKFRIVCCISLALSSL